MGVDSVKMHFFFFKRTVHPFPSCHGSAAAHELVLLLQPSRGETEDHFEILTATRSQVTGLPTERPDVCRSN